jgi:hypothetical protein
MALSVEIALEEVMDLSQDRLHDDGCYSVVVLGFSIVQCLYLDFSEDHDSSISIMNDLVQVCDQRPMCRKKNTVLQDVKAQWTCSEYADSSTRCL